MVIVSRYLPPAKSEDDSWITGFGNWFFTKLTNVLHGSQYTDAFVMFRAYKKEVLINLGLLSENAYRTPEKLFKTKIPIEPLLSVRAARAGYKLGEIPGDEPARHRDAGSRDPSLRPRRAGRGRREDVVAIRPRTTRGDEPRPPGGPQAPQGRTLGCFAQRDRSALRERSPCTRGDRRRWSLETRGAIR